jgi:hypothetical protein
MKNFHQWVAETKPELNLTEKTARAGIMSWAYPDGYIRSHYPAPYFMPVAADAIQKMGDKVDDNKVDHGKFTYKNHDRLA